MDDAARRANNTSGFNHAARRAYAPSEYRPTTRIQRKIMEDHKRKAYWCHLCYTSRLDSKGLDHHYDQAHPAQARDASSRMHTTYNDSRHGRPGRQHRAKGENSPQGFLMLRYDDSERDQPAAQLQPARSQYASASAANLIPLLLQPPRSQHTLSGYHTVKSFTSGPPLRVRTERPMPLPGSSSCKRRRLSNFNVQRGKRSVVGCDSHGHYSHGHYSHGHFGDRASEDGDEDRSGDIPHGNSPVSMRDGLETIYAKPQPNPNKQEANTYENDNELSPDAISALEAGAAYEGEAQDRTFFSAAADADADDNVDSDAEAPSEATSNDGAQSAMEMLVRRMFVKQVELRELMVEMMELARGEPFEVRW